MRSNVRVHLGWGLAITVLFLLAGRAVAAEPPSPEGRWKGNFVFIPGEAELGFSVKLSRAANGALSGTMSIPSKDVDGRPLEDVMADGPLVSFVYRDRAEISVLTGTISADGQSIQGQVLEPDGNKYPFELTRDSVSSAAPALVDLGGVQGFKRTFNRDVQTTRLLLILTPGCPTCLRNAQMIERRVLKVIPDPSLRVYVVWVPALKKDGREMAEKRTELLVDPRATHFWGGDLELADAFKQPLGMKNSSAWDVFLVFRPGVRWEKEAAPVPDLYMHRQEPDLPLDRKLNAIRLSEEIRGLLQRR